MLLIRKEQMDVLSEYMLSKFVHRMVGHLRQFLPDQCQSMDDAEISDLVRWGIGRAKSYGFSTEQDISRFINLIFIFGKDFDKNADSAWVDKVLSDESLSVGAKMDALYLEAETQLSDY